MDFFYDESLLTSIIKACSTISALFIFTKTSDVTKLYSLLIPSSAVASILVANLLSTSGVEPNLYVNILWIWIIARNQDFRNFLPQALLFAIKPLIILSSFTHFGFLANIDSGLSARGYFMPFNALLGFTNRQQGIFSHPNTLSLYCLLLIGLILFAKSSFPWFWAFVGIFELLMGGSRTFQILSLTLLLSVYIHSKLRDRFKIEINFRQNYILGIYISSLILLLLAAIGLPETISQDSLTGRIGIWKITLEIFQSNPIFGLGSNYAADAIALGVFPIGANSAHSMYLDALVTGGPILLWATLILVRRVITNANYGLNMQLFGVSLALAGLTETIWTFYSFNAVNLLFAYLMVEQSKEHKCPKKS